MVLEIAKALNFLHARGVVHMDVKSNNVLLTSVGAVAWMWTEWDQGRWRRAAGRQPGLRNTQFKTSRSKPRLSHAPAPALTLIEPQGGTAKLADVGLSRLQTGTYLSDVPLIGGRRAANEHPAVWHAFE